MSDGPFRGSLLYKTGGHFYVTLSHSGGHFYVRWGSLLCQGKAIKTLKNKGFIGGPKWHTL
jgi:hypothetical protein